MMMPGLIVLTRAPRLPQRTASAITRSPLPRLEIWYACKGSVTWSGWRNGRSRSSSTGVVARAHEKGRESHEPNAKENDHEGDHAGQVRIGRCAAGPRHRGAEAGRPRSTRQSAGSKNRPRRAPCDVRGAVPDAPDGL